MESDRAMLWTVAIAASLGLHVLVIVALLGFGAFSGSDSPTEPSKEPVAAITEQGTVPKSTESVAVERSSSDAMSSRVASTKPPQDGGIVKADLPSSAATSSTELGTVPEGDKIYVVKSGDNLSKIAKLDDSTLAELAELNGKSIKELSKLMVGQKIKVKNGIK